MKYIYQHWHIPLMMCVGIIAYANSIHTPFVFDDFAGIVHNAPVQNQDWNMLWNNHATRIIPFFTFALDAYWHKDRVVGYHIENIALHLITGLLVYLLMMSITRITATANGETIALFTGLLFIAHPIQTQAVTYIVQRTTIIASMLYIGTLIAYIYARRNNNPFTWCLVGLLTVSAMFSKEIAIAIPVTIAALEVLIFRLRWKDVKKYWLLVTLTLFSVTIIPTTLFITRGYVSTLPAIVAKKDALQAYPMKISTTSLVLSPYRYFATELRVIPRYVQLLIWPTGQNIDHDIPNETTVFTIQGLIAATIMASFILFAWKLRMNYPLIALGITIFFIGLMLESTLFPIEDVAVEHRMYLPSVGFFLAIAAGITAYKPPWRNAATVQFLIMGCVVFALTYATYERNKVWQSAVSLWTDSASKSPNKVRPNYNLAWAFFEEGKLDEAEHATQKVLTIHSNNAWAYNLLGVIEAKRQHSTKAKEYFAHAIALRPDIPLPRVNLASLLGREGNAEAAITQSKEALKLDPLNVGARRNLATAYYALGKMYVQQKQYGAVTKLLQEAAEAGVQIDPTQWPNVDLSP